jgi:hypothetical protein
MPATKISALTAGGASQATDEYVVARAGDNRKITGADIAAAATSLGIVARLQAASGTITADAPVLNLTQTWNNAGVLFTGVKLNVTDTASNVSSLLFDLQAGAATKFNIRKDGVVNFYGGQYGIIFRDTSGNIRGTLDTYASPSGYGLGQPNLQPLSFMTDGVFRFTSGAAFGWSSTTNPSANAADVTLFRDAASVLALRTGTTAQTFRVYRTFTDASNHERLSLNWSNSTAIVATEGAGTGTRGNLAFGTAALATSATRGHLMIPSCAGLATGVPADIPTGQVALIFDSTNNKLGVYDGGWIWTAALT